MLRHGRGRHKSYCVLFSSSDSQASRSRLSVMEKTNNGFVIAEKDLELRGPGEVLGTRQTGLLQFKVADLMRDHGLLPLVRDAALQLRDERPEAIAPLLNRWLRHGQQYARV